MDKKLFLLDGMALVYRAHFALIARPIFTSKGVNTSALYGFTQTLLDILRNQQPTHLAVAFDTEVPTQRHIEFPDYKATRQAMPEDLSKALPDVRAGWIVTAAVFGLLFALPFIATIAITRERAEFQRDLRPFHWKQAFIEPFQVRTFVYVLIMYVTAFTAFDATQSIVVYFIKTYLGRGSQVSFTHADGGLVVKGDKLGEVGTTGDAPPQTPHLHFSIFRLGPEKRWWEGTPINPWTTSHSDAVADSTTTRPFARRMLANAFARG